MHLPAELATSPTGDEGPTLRWYWISTARLTICVGVQEGRVVVAPPLARKFLGQTFARLCRWIDLLDYDARILPLP